jgi:hypothetical protein
MIVDMQGKIEDFYVIDERSGAKRGNNIKIPLKKITKK